MSDTKTKDTGVSLTYINNNYIRSDGSTSITGSIDMGGNTLYNVRGPVNPDDVVTKDYADNNKRKHIIAVYTNYCGDLIEGKYQFSFGGSACKETGFLMPHSGRIKKIEVRLNGWLHGELANDLVSRKVTNGHFFSIMLFKENTAVRSGELTSDEITLGKIKCNYTMDKVSLKKQLCFLPIYNDFKNYQLSEGDYINIRSEKTLAIEDEMFYLITFLVELDPL